MGGRVPYNLSTGPNNVPAGRHHSSGPKEKGLRQTFRPFFGQIDRRPKKKKGESVAKTTKKGFRQEMRIISAIYCCISIIEKKKVAGQLTIKGRGPDRMPWRVAFGPQAVVYRPLA